MDCLSVSRLLMPIPRTIFLLNAACSAESQSRKSRSAGAVKASSEISQACSYPSAMILDACCSKAKNDFERARMPSQFASTQLIFRLQSCFDFRDGRKIPAGDAHEK